MFSAIKLAPFEVKAVRKRCQEREKDVKKKPNNKDAMNFCMAIGAFLPILI
jgi:hypothetical protein